MTTIIPLVLIAGVLTFGSGCAKPDWVQDTLVTVDVTGTWQTDTGVRFQLDLEQQGSRVKGTISVAATQVASLVGPVSGPIDGTRGWRRVQFPNDQPAVKWSGDG